MTVQELIIALLSCNLKAQVIVEGCDCTGEAKRVDPDYGSEKEPQVLIERR